MKSKEELNAMKTKEEPNAPKEEVKNASRKLCELTDEELAQVTGGFGKQLVVK